MIINNLFFVLYWIIFFLLIRKEPLILIIGLLYFMNHIFLFISVYFLSSGNIFMVELNKYSHVSSFIFLILFLFEALNLFIFFIFSRLFRIKWKYYFNYMCSFVKKININVIVLIMFLIYISLFVLIINILISGSPLWVSNISKNTFWDIAKFPFLKPLSSQVLFFSLFGGIVFFYNEICFKTKFLKFLSFNILFLVVIYLVLLGHRFGLPMTVVYIFFLPLIIYKIINKQINLFKLFIKSLIVICLFVGITLLYFNNKYGINGWEMFLQRVLVMPGQLFFVVFDDYVHNVYFKIGGFINEIDNLLHCNNNYTGIWLLMNHYMPANLFNAYFNDKVHLAQAFYPLFLYYFNYNLFLEILIDIIIVSMLLLITIQFFNYILKFDILMSFLFSKIFFMFYPLVGQGYISLIFNLKFLSYLFFIIFVLILRNVIIKRKSKNAYFTYN